MSFLPLLPPDVDLTDFKFMPLHVARLRDSRIASIVSGDEFRAAVMLWCAAWHQRPAASLPNDDVELAKLAGYGRAVKEWKKLRNGALYGWLLCRDGRWWHPVVAENAADAWNSKLKQAWSRECERIRKENKRRAEGGQGPLEMPPSPQLISSIVPAELADLPAEEPQQSTGKSQRGRQASDGKTATEERQFDVIPSENALKGQGQGQGLFRPSDGEPAADASRQLWREGLATLARITGKADRPLLGKLLDAAHKDHAKIVGLLSRCEIEKPDDPIAWLMAAAKGQNGHDLLVGGEWGDRRIVTDEGRPLVNGSYIDVVSEKLAVAAGLQAVQLTDKTMIQWLLDGYEPDQILPVIRRVVERSDQVPKSLAYFDKAVREERPTWKPERTAA